MATDTQSYSWEELPIERYGPRVVRPTRLATGSQIVFRLVLLTVLFFGAFMGMHQVRELTELGEHGQVVQGKVTDQRETHGKSTNHYLTYEYEVGGHLMTDEDHVSSDMYEAHTVGSSLTVTALPSDPGIHRIGLVTSERINGARNNWIAGTVIAGLLIEGFAWGFRFATRLEMRALRDYEAFPAVVTAIGKSSGGKAPTSPVTFVIRGSDGKPIERTLPVGSGVLAKVPIGKAVTALINSEGKGDLKILSLLTLAETGY